MAGNYRSGRSGWRDRIEDYIRVDVMGLKRDGVFGVACTGLQIAPSCSEVALEYHGGTLILHYRQFETGDSRYFDVKQQVTIEHSPCRFGGSRPWFRCPTCDSRVGSIYRDEHSRFGCRKCYDLVYRSQRESWSGRKYLAANKLRWRMGGEAGAGSLFVRPKGMHFETFLNTIQKIHALETAALLKAVEPYTKPPTIR